MRFGWNPALDVPSALGRVREPAAWTVLVSMLDSTPEVATLPSLVPALRRAGIAVGVVGDDVALAWRDSRGLVEADDVLTGFDEVWLCRGVPAEPRPVADRLTCDRPLTEPPPRALGVWMREQGVVAGLGDGDGLNFVTSDEALAALWEA
jgi:hypothetical protein